MSYEQKHKDALRKMGKANLAHGKETIKLAKEELRASKTGSISKTKMKGMK